MLGLRCVRVVVVRRIVGRVCCCMAYNLVLGCRVRVNRRVWVRVNGLRLLLRVGRTNGIVGYLLIVVCGWLGILCCRCVLPRYDLNDTDAPRSRLVGGLCRCSSMSGLPRLCWFVVGMFVACY